MAFTIGMKVALIGRGTNPEIINAWRRIGANYPSVGEIYTIRAIESWKDSAVLWLVEIDNSHLPYKKEPRMEAHYFRPLVSRKIDIGFTTGADPESEKWDNRKPVPVYTFDTTEHESIMQYLRGFY